MTTLSAGDAFPIFQLKQLDDSTLDTAALRGHPCLIAFFRFARCPFCNLRLHRLIQAFPELQQQHPDFRIVAIFDSPVDHLRKTADRHQSPFTLCADPGHQAYRACGIRYSWWGVLKGMLLRMPTLLHAMAKGYLPTSIRGRMNTMPADFLIDSQGMIHHAYYGRDEGDHLSLDTIRDFVRQQADLVTKST